jgi:hypothetical protein
MSAPLQEDESISDTDIIEFFLGDLLDDHNNHPDTTITTTTTATATITGDTIQYSETKEGSNSATSAMASSPSHSDLFGDPNYHPDDTTTTITTTTAAATTITDDSETKEGSNSATSAMASSPSPCGCKFFDNSSDTLCGGCKKKNSKVYNRRSNKPTECGITFFGTNLKPPQNLTPDQVKKISDSQLISTHCSGIMTGSIKQKKGKYIKTITKKNTKKNGANCLTERLTVEFSINRKILKLDIKREDIVGDTSDLRSGDTVLVKCRFDGCNNMIDANKHFFAFLLLKGGFTIPPNGSKLTADLLERSSNSIKQCFPEHLNIAKHKIKKFFCIPKRFWEPLFKTKEKLDKAVRCFFRNNMKTRATCLLQNATITYKSISGGSKNITNTRKAESIICDFCDDKNTPTNGSEYVILCLDSDELYSLYISESKPEDVEVSKEDEVKKWCEEKYRECIKNRYDNFKNSFRSPERSTKKRNRTPGRPTGSGSRHDKQRSNKQKTQCHICNEYVLASRGTTNNSGFVCYDCHFLHA